MMVPVSSQVRATDVEQVLPVKVYPAAVSQKRLWFLDQLQRPTSAYNVHVGLWLYGPLDRVALQSSLQTIIDRHESLRTCFALARNGLIQLVLRECPIEIPLASFEAEPDPYPPAYELAKREVDKPFDLSQEPLFRALLMRIAPEEHVLLCTMHHTVTDAWSMQIFAKELSLLYGASVRGTSALLPDLPIQYGDYSSWQQELLQTEAVQKKLAYWQGNLAHCIPILNLPMDGQRPPEQTLNGTTLTFAVPAEVVAGIKSLAGENNSTLFMALLAAFKVLLHRYSGETDLLVGVPVAGRGQVETENLIGFFVDTVVLRDDLSGNPRFVDLLAQVRETTLSGLANGDVPFEKIVETLQPQRDLSYNPLFQVMFSVIKSAIRTHRFGDIVAYPYVVYPRTSLFDLSAAFVEDSDQKWWLQLDFNTDLFQPARIVRMHEDYVALLRAIVAEPQARIDDLPIAGLTRPDATRPQPRSVAEKISGNGSSPAPSRQRSEPIVSTNPIEEALLAEIWKDVLGVSTVGLRDNFFDLGGHSLLAASLVRQIYDATGRKIPVSAIFRAPTIETLASLLKQRNEQVEAEPVVMKLNDGTCRIPFFAVAAPGVDSFGFGLLARNVGGGQSLYKLQHAGPVIAGRPFEKEELAALAREYISAMRSVQPHGPYCLGGMCDGVQIAQQMILQLESQGERVALFAIFDTWVLEQSLVRRLWAVDYYRRRIRTLSKSSGRTQLATLRRAFKRWLRKGRHPQTVWNRAYWPGEDFVPPRFQAPVLLFKRPRQPYFYIRDREMGWGARSTSGVEICEIDCGHMEFLQPPQVRQIGEKLQERLRAINEGEIKAGALSKDQPLAAQADSPSSQVMS
jgi:thioesterase domain-containing protein